MLPRPHYTLFMLLALVVFLFARRLVPKPPARSPSLRRLMASSSFASAMRRRICGPACRSSGFRFNEASRVLICLRHVLTELAEPEH